MGQNEIYTSISNSISNAWNAVHSSTKSLSSGLRIKSAGDDAAGLAVSQSLRGDVASSRQGSRNGSAAISMMQTAEGAASQISSNLIRMKELATQAAGVTLSDSQKVIIQKEFDQLAAENTRIAESTEFNGKKLFVEGETTVSLGGDTLKISTQAIPQATANMVNDAEGASQTVDEALNQLSAIRGSMGAMIEQIETAVETLDSKTENILATQSRIADTDMARGIATLTSASVQSQAAAATHVHASLMTNMILSMLG